ncbi:hypothetical protein [Bordetella sp. N]|uniref:hypothetical protein n=1 Tax=Bordetella sp. N TaxID=1746199 RepID=UPI0007098A97|nr:hypothetical protein [Bordetella sp. N]ALM84289.1 hypothetical protein ASB57_16090 [Bordetella sp. N]
MDTRALLEGFLDTTAVGIRATWFVYPILLVIGIAAEFSRGKNALGSTGVRAFFTALSIVLILFAVAWEVLCFFVSQAYDREYFYGVIELGLYMLPTVIFALLQFILHYWRTGKARVAG